MRAAAVGRKHRDLTLGPSVDRLAKEDHGRLRLLTQREKGAEIGVRRDQDLLCLSGTIEQDLVIGRLKAEVTRVNGIVTRATKTSAVATSRRCSDGCAGTCTSTAASSSRRSSEATCSALNPARAQSESTSTGS